jgi:hypothetical protein
MILTPRTIYCIKLQLRMASFLKVVPYEINPDTDLLQEFPTTLSRYLWKLNTTISCFYTAYIYSRFYQILRWKDFSDINKTHFAIHLCWCVGFTVLSVGHICVWHRRREIVHFLNQFLTYLAKMEGMNC